jgi:hypothetical protein
MRLLKSAAIGTMAAIMLCASAVAGAEEPAKKAPGTGPNPYRDCGIGAALFKETAWAAVTSNVIWDLGTTAVTSATASPETCQGKSVKVAQFIIDSYDQVATETARGSGEHLNAMLEMYGCDAAAHDQIVSSLRPAMADEVRDPSYSAQTLVEKSARYYELVDHKVSTEFAQACPA